MTALLTENDVAVGESISGGPEVLESLAADWHELCDEGTCTEDPFCRPEWSIAYAHAYDRRDIAAFTARVNGRLAAVLPLVRERGFLWGVPARMLRPAADVSRFDLVLTRNEDESAAAVEAVWRCLREDTRWDVVELARVPKSGALFQIISEAKKDGFPTGFQRTYRSPILSLADLPATGEDPWLAQTSQRFRHELRRKTRRLEQQGCLRLERFSNPAPEILERFYALERSTWKGERGFAVTSDSRRLRFFNELLPELGRHGYLAVFFLTLDDQLVAATVTCSYSGKLFGLRCAFDPAFGSYSPGQILVNWMLRDCVARGVSAIDFMAQPYEWKRHWTSETVEHGQYYIFRRGFFGHALHALKFRIVPLGRKLFRRPLPA